MKTNSFFPRTVLTGALVSMFGLVAPRAFGHCDTMDGPVVLAAKAALEHKDVTLVLKWVKKDDEAQINAAFARTLAVRTKGPEARELADQFFFETLVRIHRAGEGAPFTGLKPAGTELSPAIEEADKALAGESVDKVVKLLTDEAAAGIRRRFADAREKQAHAGHNVEVGRVFVAAYVEYIHYIEGLHQAAQAADPHPEASHEDPPTRSAHNESTPAHKH
ncbi:MAG TPA: DUF6448 family protein [Candidatus Limnocylindrales bacterium]|nr:DUF6448 family protein [Candidatus Limnocylindrales bacterium]